MADYEVLANLTEEEVDELLNINAAQNTAREIIDAATGKLEDAIHAKGKWFTDIHRKYGIDCATSHVNTGKRELRKGSWKEDENDDNR